MGLISLLFDDNDTINKKEGICPNCKGSGSITQYNAQMENYERAMLGASENLQFCTE